MVGQAAQSFAGSIPAWAGKPFFLLFFGNRPKVYPRVGGETGLHVLGEDSLDGLSPRGRGNRPAPDAAGVALRSIPAWAGKPGLDGGVALSKEVYPRVGGETAASWSAFSLRSGLSPRGRGNPKPERPQHRTLGSIPAWAGKPA